MVTSQDVTPQFEMKVHQTSREPVNSEEHRTTIWEA